MHLPLQLTVGACQHRPAAANRTLARSGAACGRALDVHCTHALCCPVGGGPTRRHNAVRDAVATWLRGIGSQALIEQTIVDWQSDQHGAAVLDVVYHAGLHGRTCLDISVIDEVAVSAASGGRPYATASSAASG